MIQKYLDYIGAKHGRLTILAISKKPSFKPQFHCICECGNQKFIEIYNIVRTHSCGCYGKDFQKKFKTHGQSGNPQQRTPAYKAWVRMRDRCYNAKASRYKYYGGKGVTISDDWQSFENFFRDMGQPAKGMTLDRIDPNGNYEFENCRWATMKEQAANKTNTVFLTIDGEKIHMMEAARRYGIKFQTLWARLKLHHWTDRQAIGLDPKPNRNRFKATT